LLTFVFCQFNFGTIQKNFVSHPVFADTGNLLAFSPNPSHYWETTNADFFDQWAGLAPDYWPMTYPRIKNGKPKPQPAGTRE
jgi:hypothetical protein